MHRPSSISGQYNAMLEQLYCRFQNHTLYALLVPDVDFGTAVAVNTPVTGTLTVVAVVFGTSGEASLFCAPFPGAIVPTTGDQIPFITSPSPFPIALFSSSENVAAFRIQHTALCQHQYPSATVRTYHAQTAAPAICSYAATPPLPPYSTSPDPHPSPY
jgi:hypothetical protein